MPRWRKSFPIRECCCLGYFAVALPHTLRCGNNFAEAFSPGSDSPDSLPRTSTAKHAATRARVGAFLPAWLAVQTPRTLNLALDVDAGEREAICLAQEIKADAILMDDRAGRRAAIHCGLAVVGTIGLLEQASSRGLIELPQTMDGSAKRTPVSTRNSFMPPLNGTKPGNKAVSNGAGASAMLSQSLTPPRSCRCPHLRI